MNHRVVVSSSIGIFTGMLFAGHNAFASEPASATGAAGSAASPDALEEIIVTAEKRSENLQNVPASIAVVSADELAHSQVNAVLDLSRSVPGVSLSFPSALYTSLYIRGIGTVTNGYSVQPSVGTVVDGVVMARSASGLFNFNDIDRVEVLRGPQGTLFGKNSSGGAINMVTKDPTNDLSGNMDVTYGSYHEIKVDGAVSGALIDHILQARVAALFDSRDGYINDVYDGRDYNDNHQQGLRTKLLFTPTEGTRIRVNWDYENLRSNGFVKPVRSLGATPSAAELGYYPGFSGFPAGFLGPTNAQVIEDHSGALFAETDSRADGVSVQWDQDIGRYTLTSITAYRIWDAFQNASNNDTPIDVARYFFTFQHESQESQELRIASPKGGVVDYVAGLFFYRDFITDHEKWSLDLSSTGFLPLGTLIFPVDYTDVTDSTNYAAFGEANFHVTDKITLIAGARETHEKVNFHTAGLFLFYDTFAAADTASASNLSWRLGGRWEINSNTMTYATVSRGFKGPAFNGNTTSGNPQLAKPELTTSYEIGLKSEFLDHRVRANLALYLTNLNDFQSQGYVVPPGALVGEQFLTNAGEVRSQGVEFEMQATPARNLAFNLSAAYIDAYYVDYRGAPCYNGQPSACVNGAQDLTGQSTPNTPKFSVDANASYDFILPGPVNAFLRTDYAWRGKIQWDPTNNPLAVEGPVGLLGASAGLVSKDKQYTLSVYGRNLTDKFHTEGIQIGAGTGAPQSELAPDYRRVWGVEFRYRY